MAEMIKNVKDFETTSTVEDTCFICIPEKKYKAGKFRNTR